MSEFIQPKSTFNRRALLRAVPAGAIALTVGCGDGTPTAEKLATPTTISVKEPTIPHGGYLENIYPSVREQALWKNTQFLFLSPQATDSEIQSQVGVRANEIIGKMLVSENPEMKNGAILINQLGEKGILTIAPIKTAPGVASENLMSAKSTFDSTSGKIVYNLDIYVNNLATSDELRVALALTHEAQHFADKLTMADQARAQGAAEADIVPNIAKFVDNNCTLFESWAYATEAKAYMYQTRLMPNYTNSEEEFKAAKFAESNFDENSGEWQQTVSKNTGCTT